MRRFITILLVLIALMGVASAASSDVAGVYNKNSVGVVITIPAAETSDADQLVNDASLNSTTELLINSTGVGSSNFIDDPDVPRCLIVTPSDAVTTEIKFTGLDISGAVITENLTFAASSTAQTTTKAFKNVTRIDATTTGTTRTVDIGTADKLALNKKFAVNPVVYCSVNGARESTAPTVTVSSTVLAQNTIDTNTVPGGHVTRVWVLY